MLDKKERGFTLIELLIVIIIIGILASLALPGFGRTKEHVLGKEAQANLKLIAAAEKIYRMESEDQAYVDCDCSCSGSDSGCCNYEPPQTSSDTPGCNYKLTLSLNPNNWTYSVTDASTSAFTAVADRTDTAASPYNECIYTLTSDDTDGEPDPNDTTKCP